MIRIIAGSSCHEITYRLVRYRELVSVSYGVPCLDKRGHTSLSI